MQWPIDTTKTTLIFNNYEPVLDFETKQPVQDKDTGFFVFRVNLMRLNPTGRPEALAVKVQGEPDGLSMGEMVRCDGLTVQFWEVDRKAGISFRADRVVSAVAPRAKAAS